MKKILLIADEEFLETGFSRLIERYGFEVITANGGEEGIKMCAKHKPDAIMLDFMAPCMPGERVCASARALNPDIRICIICDDQHDILTISAMNLKPMAYLIKPFTNDDLKAMLSKV